MAFEPMQTGASGASAALGRPVGEPRRAGFPAFNEKTRSHLSPVTNDENTMQPHI
jgi:hypothetical protein